MVNKLWGENKQSVEIKISEINEKLIAILLNISTYFGTVVWQGDRG